MPKPKESLEIQTGAPAALKWLSDQVAKSERALSALEQALNDALSDEIENPPDQDGTDYAHIAKTARRNYDAQLELHMKLLDKLQKFDKSVAPEKRDASESVTREEGERVFSMVSIYLRKAADDWMTASIPEIRECRSNEEAFQKCGPSFQATISQMIKTAVGENHLPSWAQNAVDSVL